MRPPLQVAPYAVVVALDQPEKEEELADARDEDQGIVVAPLLVANREELTELAVRALLRRSRRVRSRVQCRGIVDVARTSPLADLGDLSQIRAALDDPTQVWDL